MHLLQTLGEVLRIMIYPKTRLDGAQMESELFSILSNDDSTYPEAGMLH